MIYDLHTHSHFSDGKLSVAQLLERAKQFQVDTISITDHDTLDAYENIESLNQTDIKIIPGLELSTYWKKIGIHIVGLNIDLKSTAMETLLRTQANIREQRAIKIISRLNSKYQLNIEYNVIKSNLVNGNIGRPHIAQYLVEHNIAKNYQHAFDKYLSNKKIGDCKFDWPAMSVIIEGIINAGGIAVLAHPLKYKLTRTKLLELFQEFKDCGGQAIEVLSGKQHASQTQALANIVNQLNLFASTGSDFHQANTPWAELGQFGSLPDDCKPVWDQFN